MKKNTSLLTQNFLTNTNPLKCDLFQLGEQLGACQGANFLEFHDGVACSNYFHYYDIPYGYVCFSSSGFRFSRKYFYASMV